MLGRYAGHQDGERTKESWLALTGEDRMAAIDRFRVDGRVALMSGGARGLGRVMAEALASSGASVAITARDAARAEEAASEIAQN